MDLSKTCSCCSRTKPVAEFNKKRSSLSGLAAYQPKCRLCQKAENKDYYKNNKDTLSLKSKAHYQENKLEILEKSRAYNSKNRFAKRKYNQEYYQKNKGKFREYRSFSKKRLRDATPDWLTKDHKKAIAHFYTQAVDCSIVTGEPYHVDHIMPIKGKNVCGLHVPWNLQVLPADLNLSKKNKEPDYA